MFKSVLVANRGEIACRIIRTAKALGMRTIAVYSEADRGALHVKAADQAVQVGPAASSESYLRQDRIIAAALNTGAECIHPGCGFLAENAEFSQACADAGLVFVGPSPAAIQAMGEKGRAKQIATDLGIPIVPGYFGDAQDDETFLSEAERIGFPVLLKAVAGGGGKGLKAVHALKELPETAASARREAQAAFGDSRLMIEKLVDPARHIEVQIFGDGLGDAVHLFERECTLQRRNQKVIEEAPAIRMPAALRAQMTDAALKAASAVQYAGAGTVEFILPGGPLDEATPFYFMEMNTRLQIEHPVTELITGQDLVDWQFRVAAGEGLPLAQDAIRAHGAAVEARLYAEDPATGFLPSPGKIWHVAFFGGEGIRIDSGVEDGSVVSPYYDAMIAKIIGFGDDRMAAYDRLLGALSRSIVAGPKTNLAFLHALAERSRSEADALSTRSIEAGLSELTKSPSDAPSPEDAILGLLELRQSEAEQGHAAQSSEPHSPWSIADSFELSSEPRLLTYAIEADGHEHEVTVSWTPDGPAPADGVADRQSAAQAVPTDDGVIVWRAMHQMHARFSRRQLGEAGSTSGGAVRAPMFGKLTKLYVKQGDHIAVGDRIAIVEAMKMEHVLHSEIDGVVKEVPFQEGAQVDSGATIAELES